MFDTYAEIFAERAGAYHRAMQRSPLARMAEFAAVLQPLAVTRGATLCDMPSGGCYLADHVAPALHYVGIEPVDGFRALAGPGRSTLNAPITDVPLASGSVDYVVSLAGLHHEASLAPVFAEMRRLLRPGGRLVIADVAAGTPQAQFLNGFVARHNPLGHDGRFLDERTAPILRQSGFTVVDDALIAVPWMFADRIEAADFCADLFGVEGIRREAMLEALSSELGIHADARHARLDWSLRRIICDAA